MSLQTLTVRAVRRATPRTRVLQLETGDSGYVFTAGQAVMVGLHGSPLRKPYSIASAPFEVARDGVMELLVHVDDTGGLDPHVELAAPGVALDVDGPFGTFGLPPADPDVPLLLVAGGTGIAPLRSMLLEALHRMPAPRTAMLYSARAPDEFAYRDELEGLAGAGRLTLHLTVTRTETPRWMGRTGRIDESLLKTALPAPDARCLVCGPPLLVRDVCDSLIRIGVPVGAIVVERYDE